MRSVPLLGEGLRLTFSAAAEARDLTLAVAICLASSNDLRRGDVERERDRERACALIRAISDGDSGSDLPYLLLSIASAAALERS